MSEHQVVAFRAIDAPVSEENLEFMERQSSRADITPWSFDNEYHYGGFRGNALEMLRRGYDIHLHYANYGTRFLYIRFPAGLPDPKSAAAYLKRDTLRFVKDKKGPGGILAAEPYFDEVEELWELDELVEQIVPIRAEILDGDLRPLYIAHLAMCCDGNHDPEETFEGPVPAGLNHPTQAQWALAQFLELDESLLKAAADGCPSLPEAVDPSTLQAEWISKLPAKKKDAWLARLLVKPDPALRGQILNEFRKELSIPAWPTVTLNRSIADLESAANEMARVKKEKDRAAAARKREQALASMAKDPAPTLKKVDELIAGRTRAGYSDAAELLAKLQSALAGRENANLASEYAQKLAKENSRRHGLAADLRRHGLLPVK